MSKPKRRPADPFGSRRLLNAADHFPSVEAFMRTKICYKSRLWRCVWAPWMPAQGGRYPVGAHDRPL